MHVVKPCCEARLLSQCWFLSATLGLFGAFPRIPPRGTFHMLDADHNELKRPSKWHTTPEQLGIKRSLMARAFRRVPYFKYAVVAACCRDVVLLRSVPINYLRLIVL
jgi:hypothetical protein